MYRIQLIERKRAQYEIPIVKTKYIVRHVLCNMLNSITLSDKDGVTRETTILRET